MPQRIGIEQAAHELGLRLPVRVELHADLGAQTSGRYLGIIGGSHRIAVRVGAKTKVPRLGTLICLPGVNASIWHEMTHALQCERDHAGNFREFVGHYQGQMERLMGLAKGTMREGAAHLGVKVRREMRRRGWSTTLAAYQRHPDEAEAYTNGENLAYVEVVFPVSRKTPSSAVNRQFEDG